MRNVTHLGMCWMMTLGLVAVAIGQQLPVPAGGQTAPAAYDTFTPAAQPPQGQTNTQPPATFAPSSRNDETPQNSASQKTSGSDQVAMPAPDRSLLVNSSTSSQQADNSEQRRGEIGVWMGETGGPGVRILRVTSGGAAERAGLRVGDVILQVNGRGASSPHDTATMIRQITVGQTGSITVWRDGNQQQLQITMQPVREAPRQLVADAQREVGFGRLDSANGDLASRTVRLEQQINSLTRELANLRNELAQLRNAGPVQTGFNAEPNRYAVPPAPEPLYNETPKAAASSLSNSVPAPPGFGTAEDKPVKQAADVKSSSNGQFGSDPAPANNEEKPKAEEKPPADDKGSTDDLFK